MLRIFLIVLAATAPVLPASVDLEVRPPESAILVEYSTQGQEWLPLHKGEVKAFAGLCRVQIRQTATGKAFAATAAEDLFGGLNFPQIYLGEGDSIVIERGEYEGKGSAVIKVIWKGGLAEPYAKVVFPSK